MLHRITYALERNCPVNTRLLSVPVLGALMLASSVLISCRTATTDSPEASLEPVNLAVVATPSSSYVSGDTSLNALNDDNNPRDSRRRGPGSYGNWPRQGTQWVEYTWRQPISTR